MVFILQLRYWIGYNVDYWRIEIKRQITGLVYRRERRVKQVEFK